MNFLIIAYGQTGSGKTHTVSGNVCRANGLLQKCLKKLVESFKAK